MILSQNPANFQRNDLHWISVGSCGHILNFLEIFLEEFVVDIVERRIVHFDYVVIVGLLDPQDLLFLHEFGLIRQVVQIDLEALEFDQLVEDILEILAAIVIDLRHILQNDI